MASPLTCSWLAYSGVMTLVIVAVTARSPICSGSTTFAIPKSSSLTVPSALTMMLAGFRAETHSRGELVRSAPRHRCRYRQISHLFRLDHFRDSEVKQLDGTVGSDHDVAGLQIAMHNQVLVSVSHCVAHTAEQFEPLAYVELVLIGPAVNRPSFYDLHDEVLE